MAKPNKVMMVLLEELMTKRVKHFSHFIYMLEHKPDNLMNWVKEKPSMWYEAKLEAINTQIEDILMAHKIYKGYQEYTREGVVLRWYYITGIDRPQDCLDDNMFPPEKLTGEKSV